MKLFVTGGTGFIGSHVLKRLVAEGHHVLALRRPGSFPRIPVPDSVEWLEGSLEDVSENNFEQVETVIHMAAYGVNPQHNLWDMCFRWNVTASLALWLKAIDAGVRRLIVTGSCFEYGLAAMDKEFLSVETSPRPTTAYGASKAAATMAAQAICVERDVELAIVRPFHVFGEGEAEERFWPSLRRAALQGDDFPMTAGEQVRDFVPVTVMAKQIIEHAINSKLVRGAPEIHNIGTGKPMTLLDFATEWWSKLNAEGKLLVGQLPYRENEIMRYVPEVL